MSIRLRLTLLYSTILALTLVTFSTVLYVAQARLTYDSIKSNLVRQGDAYANPQQRFPRPPEPPSGESAPPPRPEPFSAAMPGGTLPGRWSQTRSLDGAVLARTADLADVTLPLSQAGLTAIAAQSGLGWFETAVVENQPLLIYSRSFAPPGGTALIIQLAVPIAEREQSLATLQWILIIGCSLVIVVAFAAGWVLAGTALRPIERITHTAQTIGAEHDFGRRVQHVGPTDEVGQLAITFNAMLAELETAYRQLEQTLDSQRRFVADASHELRTPLTTVRGNIELLRREPPIDPRERAEVMADTSDEVDRLIRLVNQLLVLARADAGQTLHGKPLSVKLLLEDIGRQARLLTTRNTVLCSAPKEDVVVVGDRDALKQVLLILLDNALVHTSPEATVELTAAQDDDRVAIMVRDTGPGITPDVLPHIFERFYRGEVSRSGVSTGLGLAIARELIEAQGGAISVESQLGQGSVFTVTLPLAGRP
jgi:two-component system OmpR family sensor kinase